MTLTGNETSIRLLQVVRIGEVTLLVHSALLDPPDSLNRFEKIRSVSQGMLREKLQQALRDCAVWKCGKCEGIFGLVEKDTLPVTCTCGNLMHVRGSNQLVGIFLDKPEVEFVREVYEEEVRMN